MRRLGFIIWSEELVSDMEMWEPEGEYILIEFEVGFLMRPIPGMVWSFLAEAAPAVDLLRGDGSYPA